MCRWRRAVLVVSALCAVAGALGASRLRLRTQLRELLPSGDVTGRAIDDAQRRVGEYATLVVAIRPTDPRAGEAWAEELARRIGALDPRLVERAIFRVDGVRDFFRDNRWLYADEQLLTDVRDRVRYELERYKNPLIIRLDEPPDFHALEARARKAGGGWSSHLPAGRLGNADGSLLAVVVLPGSAFNLPGSGVDDVVIHRAVEQVVAGMPPPGNGSTVNVRLHGTVHTAVAEQRAVARDVVVTTVAVVVLVNLVVALFFGRLRAVPLMAAPALLGATCALGLAGVVFGTLNASTAFLGGIIIGNGINFPVLLLARYEEERAAGRGVHSAIGISLAATARPTALAAFAASIAYGSLALTRFRGFSQFGCIGALGMALCWLATITLLPALLATVDTRRTARLVGAGEARRDVPYHPPRWRLQLGGPLARLAERMPWVGVLTGVVLTVFTVVALPAWLSDPFDYDFRNMRSVTGDKDDRTASELDALFGRALSPQIVLAPSRAAALEARDTVTARAANLSPNPVERAIVWDDLLPGTPEAQRRKLAVLRDIRRLLADPALDLLRPEQRARINRWRPPARLHVLGDADVPALLRRPFVERDGTLGRVVLIYTTNEFSSWNGHDLFRLSSVIRDVPVQGEVLHGVGRASIFASMIEAIEHDGPIATVASLGGVALLTVVLLHGRAGALAILGALALGVAWMLGVAALLDEKLNFLNFVALPITFGIGVDYAANVWLRYRPPRGEPTSMPAALRSTGGACMLNSLTTIFGYGALLIAHSRALRSFGALAILGEIACVGVALLAMPALIVLVGRLRPHSRAETVASS